MADALGTFGTSYELDAALRLDIEDMVFELSPYDAPFNGTYNGLENAPVPGALPTGDVFETRYDWLEDELLVPTTTQDGAYTATGLELTAQAGEASRFQVDDLVRVVDAAGVPIVYRITAVDYDTDAITVVVWDGTDANIDDGALIEGIGTLPAEGSDPVEARATDRTRPFNYTQIFGPYPVELSETEQNVLKYGVTSEFAHQSMKRLREGVVAHEKAMIYGVRKTDATLKRRSFGGLNYFIAAANGSTVDSTTTSLADAAGEAALLALQQGCYNNGGDPRLVVVGPANKPDISAWRNSDIRYQQSERRRGEIVVSFETDFAIVDVLMHRWVLSTDLFLFNPEQAENATLRNRGWKWVNTAKTGDRDQAYVISEKGFKFRGARHSGKMTALGTA